MNDECIMMVEDEKDVKQNQPVSTFASADMILSKIQDISNVDLNKVEKLLEIKAKFEAKENEKQFQISFAKLQAELPIIPKTKEVKDYSGKVVYTYSPLEKIVEHIKPVLKKYNFSFRWSEGKVENSGYKRIYCHISCCGHTETSFQDIPIQQATKMTNAVQQMGSSTTYGKRYSLCSALGIMADEDTDGIIDEIDTPPPQPDMHKILIKNVLRLQKQYGILDSNIKDIVLRVSGKHTMKDCSIEEKQSIVKEIKKELNIKD